MSILKDFFRIYFECILLLFKIKPPFKDLMIATAKIGFDSLPIVTISTAFAGVVVSDEMIWHMNISLQNISLVPAVSGQFILRELGIAIPAFLLVSKVGASIAAEVSTMNVTEQIDALQLFKINPIKAIVYPRWLACMISSVILTLLAVCITLFFSMSVSVFRYGFNYVEYLNIFQSFVGVFDFLCMITKSLIYGSVIPIMSCAYGLSSTGGAQGVGNSTTNAVVSTTVLIIILDFILTYLFSHFF